MTLYDRNGRPPAYSEDDEHIYLFTGQPVAYFHENAVYGFNGHQFGWFENGWVRDLNGKCVFFSENSCGSGPAKPAKYAKPAKSAKYAKPAKCARYAKYAKAASAVSWSELSGIQFFNQ